MKKILLFTVISLLVFTGCSNPFWPEKREKGEKGDKLPGADVSGAPVMLGALTASSITVGGVTIPNNPGSQTVEYARSATNDGTGLSTWQDSATFNGLSAGATFYFFARAKENADYHAGTMSASSEAIATVDPNYTNLADDYFELNSEGIGWIVVRGSAAPPDEVYIPAYRYCDIAGEYLPVTAIGREDDNITNGVFEYRTNITAVHVPDTVTNIGSYPFVMCLNLESIVPPTLPNVTSIGESAFDSCDSLVSIDLPNVESIGVLSFAACGSIVSIKLPNVTIIDKMAFRNCRSLISIDLPKVTSIDERAFQDSSSLESIIIPESVTYLGYGAFGYWTPSQTIYIEGHADQASADAAWGANWREYCDATIVYLGG